MHYVSFYIIVGLILIHDYSLNSFSRLCFIEADLKYIIYKDLLALTSVKQIYPRSESDFDQLDLVYEFGGIDNHFLY